MNGYIGIDGKIEENKNSIFTSEAISFGYSIFETIKVIDGKMILFKEHVERLNKSLKLLDIDYRFENDNLYREAIKIIRKNNFSNGAIKILAAKCGESIKTIISTRESKYTKEQYKEGLSLKVSKVRRNQESILPRIKSSNYLENIFEKKKAMDQGYDDMLFLNTDNKISETCVANIFFVKDGILYTPSENSGILDGIVRQVIIKIAKNLNIKIERENYNLDELFLADEVFLTNSLMGVMPVSKIDNRFFIVDYKSSRNITFKLKNEYDNYIFLREKDG